MGFGSTQACMRPTNAATAYGLSERQRCPSFLDSQPTTTALLQQQKDQQQQQSVAVTFLLGPFSSPPLPPPTELARPSVSVFRLALPSSTPCRTRPASRYRKLILHCLCVQCLQLVSWIGWRKKRPHNTGFQPYENHIYVEHDPVRSSRHQNAM